MCKEKHKQMSLKAGTGEVLTIRPMKRDKLDQHSPSRMLTQERIRGWRLWSKQELQVKHLQPP